MEKLIKLLNEYKIYTDHKNSRMSEYTWINVGDDIVMASYVGTTKDKTLEIISKKFLFIKWLVDNNKIDTGGKITEDLTYEYFQIPRKYFRGGKYTRLSEEMNDIFYHRILACLSIQDNPIEFLISILK